MVRNSLGPISDVLKKKAWVIFTSIVVGTLTHETCENGLVFDGYGDVYHHCNYNWAVDCGKRVYDDTPISSPGCLYQYGIYPVGEGCQTTFFKVFFAHYVRPLFSNSFNFSKIDVRTSY